MKTLKTAFAALTLCLLMTSTTFAANNPVTTISKSLRTELSELVQNPQLAKHNLGSASVDVQFSIDNNGEISVLKSTSVCPYLIQFIQKKVDGQQLDSTSYIPGTTYQVRFSFKLQ